ncbi:MAG: FAD/NAD(P)-binding protein [Proteobacteria bacterium]|nr:FAD/NAD(P)-binding protein [Pseudomonadota bacterium]
MMPAPGPRTDVRHDAVIIGGGAAGTLVAIRLLAAGLRRIAIVEPDAMLARGAAYATDLPEHLLNVIASRMSALDEDPGHFVRFLAAEQPGADPATLGDSFAPRRDYGRYLRHTLAAQPGHETLVHVRDRAVDAGRDDASGDTLVQLASGNTLHAGHVVLAVGNASRTLPAYLRHEGARIADAWDYAAVRGIAPDAEVCIIGSGLSMVDAVLSLAANGHRGRIHVLSRHGLMPLPHARSGSQHGAGVDDLLPLGVPGRWRAIRQRVSEGVAAGEPWQWSFDRLRHHGEALWRSLDDDERRRFLRHAVRYWDIHRHRIAPQVAAVLEQLQAAGQLDVAAGRLLGIEPDAHGGSRVRLRPRHAGQEQALHADWIVNATGVETNIDLRPGELMQALRTRGRVLPGRHGIGIASSGVGQVLDAHGRPDPRLLVLGALRIGDLWESIAIPELRVQARQVAEHITARG